MREICTRTTVGKIKIKIDNKEQFIKDLFALVDSIENKQSINTVLYDKMIKLGINKTVLDQMIDRVRVCASYDDDNETNINFPYEKWVSRLTEYYTGEIK